MTKEQRVFTELQKVGFRALRGKGSDHRQDDDLQEGYSLQNASPNILLTWQDKEDIIAEVVTDITRKARREGKSIMGLLAAKGREKGIPWQAVLGSAVKWKEKRFHQNNARQHYRWEERRLLTARLNITLKHSLRKGISLTHEVTFQQVKRRKRVKDTKYCPYFDYLQDSVRSQEYYRLVELIADIEEHISEDLKELALLKLEGYSVREIASRLGCSKSHVSNMVGELREQLSS